MAVCSENFAVCVQLTKITVIFITNTNRGTLYCIHTVNYKCVQKPAGRRSQAML